MVLRTYKFGEADRVVVMLGRASGKIRAVAKGVRRTGSKFGSRLEPGSVADVQLYEGRGDLDTVTQVETVEAHPATRGDLSRMGHAAALLEAVDQLAQDREPNPRLHDMLVGGLRVHRGVRPAGGRSGVLPEAPGRRGRGAGLRRLRVLWRNRPTACSGPPSSGGLRCGSCGGGRVISDETLALARAVLGGGLNAVLDLPAGSAVHDVEALASTLLEAHIERRLRAIRVTARQLRPALPAPGRDDGGPKAPVAEVLSDVAAKGATGSRRIDPVGVQHDGDQCHGDRHQQTHAADDDADDVDQRTPRAGSGAPVPMLSLTSRCCRDRIARSLALVQGPEGGERREEEPDEPGDHAEDEPDHRADADDERR